MHLNKHKHPSCHKLSYYTIHSWIIITLAEFWNMWYCGCIFPTIQSILLFYRSNCNIASCETDCSMYCALNLIYYSDTNTNFLRLYFHNVYVLYYQNNVFSGQTINKPNAFISSISNTILIGF